MDLKAIRNRIASQHPTGIHAHPRPPGSIAQFPCYVVLDPQLIDYHPTMGGRITLTLGVRVIVSRSAEQDNTPKLDDLLSSLPAELEAIDPNGLWRKLAVTRMSGGYQNYTMAGREVGVSADLTVEINLT